MEKYISPIKMLLSGDYKSFETSDTFSSFLKKMIEKSGITKTELSRRIGLTSINYILHILAERKNPPTRKRCEDMAKHLRLSEEEAQHLYDLAFFERNKKDLLDFYKENSKRKS